MNTDHNTSTTSQNGPEYGHNHWNERDYFAWARTPGFNPMKLATVVAGFAIFPPLGAAALLYFLWKGRRGYGPGWSVPAFAMGPGGPGGPNGQRHHGCGRGRGRWTGNRAFDEHQAEVMQNLRSEREAFWAFRQEQRRKRDQEAYDTFRASSAKQEGAPGSE